MKHTWLVATLPFLAAVEAHAQTRLTGEVALDSSWQDRTFNQEFSDNPGVALDLTLEMGDHFYVNGWVRGGLASFNNEADRETDYGAGIVIPLGPASLDLYAGRWDYGTGGSDDVLQGGLTLGALSLLYTNLAGITDASIGTLAYEQPLGERAYLTPSVSYVQYTDDTLKDATNWSLTLSYVPNDHWRVEGIVLFEEDVDASVGIRVARTFSLGW